MIEHWVSPEVAHTVVASTEAMAMLFYAMAFSAKQRAWFRERDNNECQGCRMGLHHSRDCTGSPDLPEEKRKLQVHHVIPQRYANRIGMETADFPENGITLGASFHQEDIHPDMKDALGRYRRGDREAFKQVGPARDELLSRGEIYWNDEHDRLLSTRAIQQTQRFEKDEPFPTK